MKELVINVERTGFPIKIRGHEYFFDCSVEAVEQYRLRQEKLQALIDSIDDKDESLETNLKSLKEAYDGLVGQEIFDELYKEVPDLLAWVNAFWGLLNGINERLDEFYKQQYQINKTIANEYLTKKG